MLFDDAHGGNKRGRGDSWDARCDQELSREFRRLAKIGTAFFARFLHRRDGRNVVKREGGGGRRGYIKIVGFEFFRLVLFDFANSSNVVSVLLATE